MAEGEDRLLVTNVIKRRALTDEVFLATRTVGGAMTAKALGARAALRT